MTIAIYVSMTYIVLMDRVSLVNVKKKLKKLPIHIVKNLQRWAMQIEMMGLKEVRKIPGYHDEPLRGKRKGQRSVRLSKAYRTIYTVSPKGKINIVSVEEVNKHDY